MYRPTHIILLVSAAMLSLGTVGLAVGDDDDHEDGWVAPRADVAPVTSSIYRQECGSCHMAYQPGLLPALDWARIMAPASLADHYGDDASLSDPPRAEIASYLVAHSADQGTHSRSRAFALLDPATGAETDAALPRITRTRYFIHEHHEIPERLVTGNPDVASFSQCNNCHLRANDGIYNEDQVSIPGFGHWED